MNFFRDALSKRRQAIAEAPFERYLDNVTGVIHVGANTGQERDFYASKGLRVLWIEPIANLFEELRQNISAYANQHALCALITDREAEVTAFLTSHGFRELARRAIGTHASGGRYYDLLFQAG
jgi:hypothetical protein